MRKTSGLLAVMMLVNLFAGMMVFADTPASRAEVIYSSTFSDYNGGVPAGWTATVIGNTAQTTTGTKGTEANGNVFYQSTDKEPAEVIPFGKVIGDGKLHISYKAKYAATTGDAHRGYVQLSNAFAGETGTEQVDVYCNATIEQYTQKFHVTHLVNVPGSSNTTYTKFAVAGGEGKSTTPWQANTQSEVDRPTVDKWYKFDIIVDVENYTYSAYVNGQVLLRENLDIYHEADQIGFDAFGFYQNHSNTTSYDDICITHYEESDEVKLLLDAGTQGLRKNNKKINVVYNDYFADIDDSKITVKENGVAMTGGYTISDQTANGFAVTLDTVASGAKYTIEVNDVSMTGAAAKLPLVAAEDIYAAFDLETDYKYYYVNEDFEGYTDSNYLPDNWYTSDLRESSTDDNDAKYYGNTTYTKYSTGEKNHATVASADGDGGGKALKLDQKGLIHYFDRGIINGDFTMDFDVMYEDNAGNNAWGFNFINYYDHEVNSLAATADAARNNAYLNRINRFMFNVNSSSYDSSSSYNKLKNPSLIITKAVRAYPNVNDAYGNDTGVDVTKGAWHNLKLRFDVSAGKIYISLDDAKEVEVVDEIKNRFLNGIMGVRFYIDGGDGALYIDNVKIYTEGAELINQSFDTYSTTTTTERFPYMWRAHDHYMGTTKATLETDYNLALADIVPKDTYEVGSITVASDEAKASGAAPSGNAAAFYAQGADNGANNGDSWYYTAFSHPVKAGQPYAIEFDLKHTAVDESASGVTDTTIAKQEARWAVGPLTKADIISINGYNAGEATSNNNVIRRGNPVLGCLNGWLMSEYNGGEFTDTLKSRVYDYRALTVKHVSESNTNLRHNSGAVLFPIQQQKLVEPNTWNHYRIEAYPSTGNETQYNIYVNGTKYTTRELRANNKEDIWGMSLDVRTMAASNYVALDNLKAYLIDESGSKLTTASQVTIKGISVENKDGKVEALDVNEPKLTTLAEEINIKFSENVAEVLKAGKKITSGTNTFNNIYDAVEDVVKLKAAGSTGCVPYTASINGDTVTLALSSDLSTGTYALQISDKIGFASSSLAALGDDYFKLVSVESVEITASTKLMAYTTQGDATELTTIEDVKKAITAENTLKLVVDGYNYTGDINIFCLAAFYKTEGATNVLTAVTSGNIDSAAGSISKDIVVNTPETGVEYDTVKLFVWNNNLKPYIDVKVID